MRTVVILQHGISTMYFFGTSLLHYLARDVDILAMNGIYMKETAVIYFCIALLNLFAVLQPCWPARLKINLSANRVIPINLQANRRHFSAHMYISTAHFVEILCETYFAYIMAMSIAQQHVAYMYSVVLSVNCIATPWLLFVKDTNMKVILIDFVDSFMGFLLCILFPLIYFALPLLQFKLFGTGLEVNDYVWYVQILPPARVLVTSSIIHLFATILPNVSSWLTLRRILHRLNDYTGKNSLTSSESSSEMNSTDTTFKTTHYSLGLTRKQRNTIIITLSTIWGAVVISAASLGVFTDKKCPISCLYASAPWFQTTCNCLYYRLNCIQQNIFNSTSIDDYIQMDDLGMDLLFFHIQECNIPGGVRGDTLAKFPKMFALRLEMTQLVDWNISSSYLPPSLMRAEIRYSQLNHVPKIFENIKPSLKWLCLVGSNITTIPDDVAASWQNLHALWLSEGNFMEIPESVLKLEKLVVLWIDRNRLEILPRNISTALPRLTWLYLEFNLLKTIPDTLSERSMYIYLNGNPISSFPMLSSAAYVDLTNTPLCNQTKAGCHLNCSPQCSKLLVENYVCDVPCNTSSCQYDSEYCILH